MCRELRSPYGYPASQGQAQFWPHLCVCSVWDMASVAYCLLRLLYPLSGRSVNNLLHYVLRFSFDSTLDVCVHPSIVRICPDYEVDLADSVIVGSSQSR